MAAARGVCHEHLLQLCKPLHIELAMPRLALAEAEELFAVAANLVEEADLEEVDVVGR